jgi:hypothetical protein
VTVKAFTSGDVWLIESNGLATHQMMVGITSWQQQFSVSQDYPGTNAWQIPRTPELADEPISARTGLFRGAIALAANGVPIFNALNNRGDDAFLVGELDGFALYGSVEPDGSPLEALDEHNGHLGADGVYHYRGTATYPHINGGLVGVVEVSDQVEPQPVTSPRPTHADPQERTGPGRSGLLSEVLGKTIASDDRCSGELFGAVGLIV